ncbi:MAG: lysophospholipid acyltransferase family protein [Vicinamibacterales bacterium]|jgi:hypothetical protein|nr:hypothetical protein [Acidobacteriota bacterium]MDP7294469.1 lysophospholipid acyltransferase family protein [Vicinamibacterales bacterium]MDP7472780.1 lysophospholipid acyltransferase family protein [Vicinamibacterales bacterium]MDP7672843.1 lysophospholipid acyltransferase family protein [Vicinamibacterales bacterium]HJO38893.1 lysophospholipid acyltransferase family protein [Vicinamibacterales bacterium]
MSEASTPRLTTWQRAKAATIALLGYPLIALLGATLRWRVSGLERFDEIAAGGRRPVMAFWHGRILSATYYFRGRGIVVITSENFDGEWIARIIERFGYGTARGSSSRGGQRALLQLKRALVEGKAAGFTLDGPRGPAERAQPGAVWLAGATGQPLLPFHLEADRSWVARSWDRTQIPKPFSRVALAVGAPIEVPPDADEAVLEAKRLELEEALRGLVSTTDRLLEAR